MKAISLIQPWASLWVVGIKIHETRSWSTKHRGDLLVHASMGKPAYAKECYERILSKLLGDWKIPKDFHSLPRGGIIGIVKISEVLRTEDAIVSSLEMLCGDFTPGRFAWKASHHIELPFKECKGKLGLWEAPSSNCPLETGVRPCMCDLPRCPVCNYTKHDAAFEMDHSFCKGVIPVL